jgi:hypothetical protein
MQTSRNTLPLLALVMATSSMNCVVVAPCATGLTDCGGYCADLRSDEADCGGCALSCLAGDFCSQGLCIVGTCAADSTACGHDSDCCANYCASDGLCGCIPTDHSGCAGNLDCCSGHCSRNGVCDP